MHCTDFFQIGESIRRAEQAELRKALEAHGGLFRFGEGDEKDLPVISFNIEMGPTDVTVLDASVDDKGQVHLRGIAIDDIIEMEYPADEVMPTHTHFITLAVPPVGGVEDVADKTSPYYGLAAETADRIG